MEESEESDSQKECEGTLGIEMERSNGRGTI
jgi:hypothetical protein